MRLTSLLTLGLALALLPPNDRWSGSFRGTVLRAAGKRQPVEPNPVVLAELLVTATLAGLPPGAAFEWAGRHASTELAHVTRDIVRSARNVGLSRALLDVPEPFGDLCTAVARSTVTGTGLVAALLAYIEQARADEHAERMAGMQRLPIKLLFPLALLILPGFILLVVGPVLVEAFGRIQNSLPPVSGR
ncbi:MAG: hypothetical protein HKN07_10305 [Acidimicrobiia bacterium]|nr:type II secretion system F family protein [Acidimicrobiia bacterium]NNF64638.1 hypothetical protein [Acidimicrobiia bacterium]